MEDQAPIGLRIKRHRERAGISQRVLADRVNRSTDWVKQVENGRMQPPKLPMLLAIADALGLADLAELTGNGHAVSVNLYAGEKHAALGDVQAALTDFRRPPAGRSHNVAHIAERLRAAWEVRHSSPDHRTQLGTILPSLIRDAQAAARTPGPHRREARRVLAGVYQLADFYVAYQRDAALVWMVADRALNEAYEADDPYLIACSTWAMVQALRDSGRWEEALDQIDASTELLTPYLDRDETPDDWRGIVGALEAEAALVHGRRGRHGDAWAAWDRADRWAQALGPDYRHVQTSFSQAIQTANAVTLGVDLRRSGEALRAARDLDAAAIPSVPRRSRHLIEVARAYDQRDEHAAVLALLDSSQRTAPETISYNGFARQLLLGLLKKPPAGMSKDVRQLCQRVGVAA
ncbi:transcriptional regulator [Nocardia mangyaensis]|uniref:Transcriptional regulator n=1 Tax=Nocardia mangyaensis TaxID=2213200 RepID=A0A1J0VWK6_9NOCA|nr:helix-turn-helix transcriptional regulator [Nocardia mangyaensis]APE36397.1 transcriptional regulator [Nocardia mangyaensis]